MSQPYIEIRKKKEDGAPYIRHSIVVAGKIIHEQLSPYSEDEIEWRIHQHLHPEPMRPFEDRQARPGPKAGSKPKKATVNERGFLWESE